MNNLNDLKCTYFHTPWKWSQKLECNSISSRIKDVSMRPPRFLVLKPSTKSSIMCISIKAFYQIQSNPFRHKSKDTPQWIFAPCVGGFRQFELCNSDSTWIFDNNWYPTSRFQTNKLIKNISKQRMLSEDKMTASMSYQQGHM